MPKNGGRSLSISEAVTVALVRVEITQLCPSSCHLVGPGGRMGFFLTGS